MSAPFNERVPDTPTPKQFPVKCVKGMRLIEYKWIALKDINAKNCNWGRFRGTKGTGVAFIEDLLKNGEYEPTLHEPPVVDQNGNLISGKHRYDAHDGQNLEFIWCAVCHFDDDDARNDYALDENMRSPFKTDASIKDFVFATAQIVKRGIKINQNKSAVQKYIAKRWPVLPQGWPSRSALAEQILEKAEIDYVPIEIMKDEKIVEEYYNEFGVDLLANSHYMIRKLTGKKNLKRSDRWIRLQRDLLDDIASGIDTTIIVTFSEANSQDIPKLRRTCLELKSDMITNALKLTTGRAKTKLGNISFVFTKQLPTD